MANLKFYIVDVFAEGKYEGNQLAVVRGGSNLPDETLQKIAREMHFSETTFIIDEQPAANGGFPVRIFTPEEEIPFAGHPTLGTAFIIREKILRQPADKILLNLKAGQIPVDFPEDGSGVVWMTQLPPVFGEFHDALDIAKMLTLPNDAIDSRFPCQTVSTGTPFIIAPVKSLDAVKMAQLNRSFYFDYIKKSKAKSILFFAPETYHESNQLNARMFADFYGVPEDPATGSANGCLAGWLVKYRFFDSEIIDVRVEQGCEIHRPSLLYLKADMAPAGINVHVGGKVVPIAEGVLV